MKHIVSIILSLALWSNQVWAEDKPVKIYVFAGQSNMEARYPREFLEENHPELVKDLGIWHVSGSGRAPLSEVGRFGADHAMAYQIAGTVDQPIIVFRYAEGGTSLFQNWRPPSAVKRAGGTVGPLYKRLVNRFHHMVGHLEEFYPDYKGQGYEIAAFVWFQGESDTYEGKIDGETVKPWREYEQNLSDLISDVRRDFGVPELPVMIPQINVSPNWEKAKDTIPGKDGEMVTVTGGEVVRDAEQKVAESTPGCKWVPTKELTKSFHYDANAYVVIGQRMGKAMAELATKIQPTDPEKIKKAYQQFREREYKDTNPDTSSLSKGLICYFPFDEGEGDIAMDRSSRGLKGTLITTEGEDIKYAPEWIDGVQGKALRFTARNRVEVPDYRDPADDQGKIEKISFSYWINKPSGTNGVHLGRGDGKKDGWQFTEHANRGQLQMFLATENEPYSWTGPFGIRTSGDGYEWHHIVVVFDGPNQGLNWYFDGIKINTPKRWVTENGEKTLIDKTPAGWQIKMAAPDTSLVIGPQGWWGKMSGPGVNQAFDEVAIWDRALSDDEVQVLYNNGNGVSMLRK